MNVNKQAQKSIKPAPIVNSSNSGPASLPAIVTLESKFKRPDKPKSLSRVIDSTKSASDTDNTYTFHHKLNAQKLLDAFRRAATKEDRDLLAKLQLFAGRDTKSLSDDFTKKLFDYMKTNDELTDKNFVREFDDFLTDLIWAPWNGFFGPKPDTRIDDPKHDLDTHYSQSGAVTPRSALAHELADEYEIGQDGLQGNLLKESFSLDLDVLAKKLADLADKGPSEYDQNEWEKKGSFSYQKNKQGYLAKIFQPDTKEAIKHGVSSEFELKVITTNDARQLSVSIDGSDKGDLQLVGDTLNLKIMDLEVGKTVTLTIFDKSTREKIIISRFHIKAPQPGEAGYAAYEAKRKQEKTDFKASQKDWDADGDGLGFGFD